MFAVYCHTNKINGKMYVGITSQHVYARWQNGKHYSRHSRFYADILKFGWHNFDHKILCSGISKDGAEEIERNLIEGLNLTDERFGYNTNLSNAGLSCHTEKTKEKIRAQSIGKNNPFFNKKHTEETKLLMAENRPKRAVMCIETGIVYKSTREAERLTGADHGDISKCCNNKKNKSGGFHWKYSEERG